MITRLEMKENAKNSLKGKYKTVIIASILYVLISFAVGIVLGILGIENETVVSIVSLLISALFELGYLNIFLKISRNEEVGVSELWSKTNMFLPYIVASIVVGFFTFAWSLLFIIPGIIAALRYSMIYYIMLDNPEMSAMDALNESKRLMDGHKMDYFLLGLSFIGWAILGIFTVGILYLWLIPYMSVAQCNFYNNLKKVKQQ